MASIDLENPEQLNVLVIDDNPLVHDLVKRALYQQGVQNVRTAENAFYGLALCAKMHFHIVVTAYNVKSDRDGYHILEEMKFKGYVSKQTVLIFLSSETQETLVHSVSELQPDDFWAKPLTIKLVQQRLAKILEIKSKLANVFECIDQRDFGKAVYYIDRHIKNPEVRRYHQHLLKMRGECLISLFEYEEAESYYRSLLAEHKNSWVYLGYVKSLLKQNKMDDVRELIDTLTNKAETRFAAYDMLAQYYVDNEDYQTAFEEIKKAAALSPRNIARNRKVWDLARLNHDQRAQYEATINMAKYAKKSIHDSPELLLNVIRSGVDLATAVEDKESNQILQEIEKHVVDLGRDYEDAGLFKEQLAIARARIHNAKSEKDKAKRIIEMQVSPKPGISIEDNLDKVKAYHEVGFREEAVELLQSIKQQIACDNLAGAVTIKFVEQETKEKQDIHFTPKQLNRMAIEFFKKQKMEPALHSLTQALQLTPQDVKASLSLLKVLVAIHRSQGLDLERQQLASSTINKVKNLAMNDSQLEHYHELKNELVPALVKKLS